MLHYPLLFWFDWGVMWRLDVQLFGSECNFTNYGSGGTLFRARGKGMSYHVHIAALAIVSCNDFSFSSLCLVFSIIVTDIITLFELSHMICFWDPGCTHHITRRSTNWRSLNTHLNFSALGQSWSPTYLGSIHLQESTITNLSYKVCWHSFSLFFARQYSKSNPFWILITFTASS